MKVLIYLGLICLVKGSALSGRLINSQPALESDKFAVRVISFVDEESTTGGLATGVAISTNYALSVAQVLYGFKHWYVAYGSIHVDNQNYQRVDEVLVHPEYYPATLSNNIGVLRLPVSVGSDGFIPIASTPLQFPIMTTFGYGVTDENTNAVATTLQQLVLMKDDYVCETEYQGINITSVICGAFPYSTGFGFGDQGGPITDAGRSELHGLVSYWGYDIDNPVVGVNISFYNEFISNAMILLD